jgi:hypothetical protein
MARWSLAVDSVRCLFASSGGCDKHAAKKPDPDQRCRLPELFSARIPASRRDLPPLLSRPLRKQKTKSEQFVTPCGHGKHGDRSGGPIQAGGR